MTHPDWCDVARRCSASAGPAGIHRSAPVWLPTQPIAVMALWQPNPTRDNPQPTPYVAVIAEAEALADAVAVQNDRRHERRLMRAKLRRSLTGLVANARRAAA